MKMKKKKGFTLIEMLAAVAIFAIIAIALVSMVTTTLKFNIANKTTFDANSNSRAFYEAIRSNRPSSTNTYPTSGMYYSFYFDKQEDINTFVNTQFKGTLSTGYSTKKNFSLLKSGMLNATDKYVIQIYVDKKTVTNPLDATKKSIYYELTTQSYDLSKDQYTEIERKSIIAEE